MHISTAEATYPAAQQAPTLGARSNKPVYAAKAGVEHKALSEVSGDEAQVGATQGVHPHCLWVMLIGPLPQALHGCACAAADISMVTLPEFEHPHKQARIETYHSLSA